MIQYGKIGVSQPLAQIAIRFRVVFNHVNRVKPLANGVCQNIAKKFDIQYRSVAPWHDQSPYKSGRSDGGYIRCLGIKITGILDV
ncbi:hypothetical protein [Desulfobacter hydrogenophilus]|uniref:Uncharacterized protein n=1 Tax=Desulfobacter hydrogenophilus TaxID=2291 RepID=A0ABX5RFI9_9BACT|nr:hypothetical protein [Desulfobacter hydrogenophilus]NDY74520.1 hypothetical protein [Desulfobacter hydrogenophilus]QBH13657.1 hypothetical protein EYB58_12430 [Desulfobacter hydrogenophilus]